ncbi:hypothetical protein [Paraflavitalea soli]|uniref:hypothetical protein n=1 Tax=Paraflavitalea soli TaxID=2315862 RepID=UPI0013C4BC6E|nr:hypothetical protein [Paraflavitalea soli]
MNSPILLHCQDIQNLTGKSASFARAMINEIWKAKGKLKQRWITISDCAHYLDISEETIIKWLSGDKR